MTTTGIIAEYNPFHKGHEFHIRESLRLTNADFVIAVMSGSFVQRGAPAMFDKYVRTEAALKHGVSLVLELPSAYALSSAEGFAFGAVNVLNRLNVTDFLSFGSECGDINTLKDTAGFLLNYNSEYDMLIKESLKGGKAYPKALEEALKKTGLKNTPKSPNDILGVEYCKALLRLESKITPITIKREDNGYENEDFDRDSQFISAKAIRNLIGQNDEAYKKYLPDDTLNLYTDRTSHTDDYSDILYYKLLSESDTGFEKYADVGFELSSKIIKELKNYTTLSEFIMRLKSKNMTHSHISRALFHILFNMYAGDREALLLKDTVKQVRVLGFRRDAAGLLSKIKERSDIALITKPADAPPDKLFNQDIYLSTLYSMINKSHINELKMSPIII